MALDHYVSQVYLKGFYSPALGDRMYALRKENLKFFTPAASAVCAIRDGSTNEYLINAREIEEFLKTVEPNYNSAIEKIRNGVIDKDCIYTISGFIAFVTCCSPAGMRIHTGPIQAELVHTAALLDARGDFPLAPPELGGLSLSALLDSGAVELRVDKKMAQAIGIGMIERKTTTFGNFKWEILHNEFSDNPFFSSDYPVAIERTTAAFFPNWIVPLAPDLAVRIIPELGSELEPVGYSFPRFKSRAIHLSRLEVRQLNRLIVQCAEDLVFFSVNFPWIASFVEKNRHYWIGSETEKIKTTGGTMLKSAQKIVLRH